MRKSTNEVMVKIPATSANLGPGFDTLGLALDLYNYVTISWSNKSEIEVNVEGFGQELMDNQDENMVYHAARKVLNHCGENNKGLYIRLENNIPFCRGLGSSAAAIVGGAVAANQLIGEPMDKEQLLDLVFDIEGHPDNIFPAMYGGLVVSSNCGDEKAGEHKYMFKKINLPRELQFLAVIPKDHLDTQMARQALPKMVKHSEAVYNLGRVSLLILAFQTADYNLMHHAMNDCLHEQYRAKLLPGLSEALHELRGFSIPSAISGAGPSVLAVVSSRAEEIKRQIEDIFKRKELECHTIFLRPENQGAQIIYQHEDRKRA